LRGDRLLATESEMIGGAEGDACLLPLNGHQGHEWLSSQADLPGQPQVARQGGLLLAKGCEQ
jgi:hypothetical protein